MHCRLVGTHTHRSQLRNMLANLRILYGFAGKRNALAKLAYSKNDNNNLVRMVTLSPCHTLQYVVLCTNLQTQKY